MRKLVEIIKLIRPINCILAAVGIWIGARLTWESPIYFEPAMTSLAAFFICAAGNVFNDLRDIDIDRINRPERVLVKGTVDKMTAFYLSIMLNVVAISLSILVNLYVIISALAVIGLLFWYNLSLKKFPLVGNLIIAFLAGLLFITGGMSVDFDQTWQLPGPLVGFWFAFLFHLVREIIKDMEDIEGDYKAGIKSLPQRLGFSNSTLLVIFIFLALVILTYIPVLEFWFSDWYKILTVYVVDLPLLALLIILWGNPTKQLLRITSHSLKLGMAIGLIALILA